jgi:hypothetical protein
VPVIKRLLLSKCAMQSNCLLIARLQLRPDFLTFIIIVQLGVEAIALMDCVVKESTI